MPAIYTASAHIEMDKRISWQVEWIQSLPHFHDARRILEVGSGTFATTYTLARKYPDKEFVGIDFAFPEKATERLKYAEPRNLTAIRHDIRSLDLLASSQFDFAYSIAVLEHVRELEAHLRAIYLVLKSGGRYTFKETPFWSSSHGHHFEHNSPECPVPPYGHLMMSREELGAYLTDTARKEPAVVAKILSEIYDREDLSRLSRTETRAIIAASPFVIESWSENQDRNYTDATREAVLRNNIYRLDPEDLKISGVSCTLYKPPEPVEKPGFLDTLLRKAGLQRLPVDS